VEKDVSHWLKNGGVLKGSGRGGLNRVSMQALRAKLVEMCTGAIKRYCFDDTSHPPDLPGGREKD